MTARLASAFLAKITREAIENDDIELAGTAFTVLAEFDPDQARAVWDGMAASTIREAETILGAAS